MRDLLARANDTKECFSEGYATLRFHVIRENEHPWLKSDLEAYKDEAFMVQEC